MTATITTTKAILVSAFASLIFSTAALAGEQLTSKSGILQDVDFSTYTLSIADANGNIESYSFTPKTRTTIDGRTINLRRALKPGYAVELKFRADSLEQASR